MSKMQETGTDGQARETASAPHRLRAVVASYRPALQAFTLIVTPGELMALCVAPDDTRDTLDPRARNHLACLHDDVCRGGLALPGAILVAVAGGRLRCECDHLYALELDRRAGDRLIVLDGYERLAELAHGDRSHCQTFVSAVLWRTAVDATSASGMAPADHAAMHGCAAARWASAARVWH